MIIKAIENPKLLDHLNSISPDGTKIFLLGNGTVRGSLLHGTKMINQMRVNHGLGILETLALGHAYIGTGLLTSMIKGNDRIGMMIECGGPIKGISTEASADGGIRGYLLNNPIPIGTPLESFDLSPFFGPGFLKITRYIEGARHPFSGQVMLNYGNIAQDLALYFNTSEQIKTLFSISIKFDREGDAIGAGGLFLQELPGADGGVLGALEDRVKKMPSIGLFFSEKGRVEDLITDTFKDFSPGIIADKQTAFSCSCSKEKFGSFLSSLKGEEKEKIMKEGPFPLVTTCHNCGTDYEFTRDEVMELFSN